MLDDHKWMQQAIEVGKQNPKAPFGTVLVDRRTAEVVETGVNHTADNPIMHGEMDALNRAALAGINDWANLCLYTTAEPCCMCQAAILWAGIPRVVFGTSVATLVRLGWSQFLWSAQEVADAAPFAKCEIVGGIREDQCDELFRKIPSGRG